MPQVLNRRNFKGCALPANAVYVGRPSKFGNPFEIGKDGDRDEVIRKFRKYFHEDKRLVQHAKDELKGKDLVCWCSPLLCHADVILSCVNEETDQP